jgi:hypothetical protein
VSPAAHAACSSAPDRIRAWILHVTSLTSIALCIVLWQRAKTVDEDERANAERRALFVGLWPPMFWLIAGAVGRVAARGRIPWR